MEQKKPTEILLLTQNSGTAWWRVLSPLRCLHDHHIINLDWCRQSDQVPQDCLWIARHDIMIVHQLWDDRTRIACQYFKSIDPKKRLIVSLDDIVFPNLIPRGIPGRMFYMDPGIQANIKHILDMSDRIIVTTEVLKNVISTKYQIPPDKIVCLPNYPDFNWLGRYMPNPQTKASRWLSRKDNPRIGLIGSLSHHDLAANGRERMDIDIIMDALPLMSDLNPHWVMTCPDQRIMKAMDDAGHTYDIMNMSPIADYPGALQSWDLDFTVVPLLESTFNDAKSNIKLLETAAMGIPALTSKSKAYDEWADIEMTFDSPAKLSERMHWMVDSWTDKRYAAYITRQYEKFYSMTSASTQNNKKNWWLQANIAELIAAFTFNEVCQKQTAQDEKTN